VPLLLIDLDNTLLERAGAFRAWAESFLRKVDAPYDVEWVMSVDAGGATPRWDVADALRARYHLLTSSVELVEELQEAVVEYATLDPLVACALRIAGDTGWVPVVVTNGQTRQQEAKIRRSGLDRFVADWVVSEEAGVSKPNPRIFELAAERVRMGLRGAWMVGDSPEADIGGAAALGLPSVWLHRGRRWTEMRYGPTRTADGVIPALACVMDAR
jgi:putative hydrolase of the HAD superfamily